MTGELALEETYNAQEQAHPGLDCHDTGAGRGGRQVKDMCRELGISDATFHVWKSKYGSMEASDVLRLRDFGPTTQSGGTPSLP